MVSIGSDEDGLRLLLEQEQRQPQWINLKRYIHALISYAKEFSIIMLEDWRYCIYGDIRLGGWAQIATTKILVDSVLYRIAVRII